MVSKTHNAGFIEKYRARKAHTKELATFSRQELEQEYRKLRNPNPPTYEEIFGLSSSSPTTSASSSIYDAADDSQSASSPTTSSSLSPSRNRSRESSLFGEPERENESRRDSASNAEGEPIDVNGSTAVRARRRTSIRTTEFLSSSNPLPVGPYERATQIQRPGQGREGGSSGLGRRMSFLRRAS